jgi:hypothetical protein
VKVRNETRYETRALRAIVAAVLAASPYTRKLTGMTLQFRSRRTKSKDVTLGASYEPLVEDVLRSTTELKAYTSSELGRLAGCVPDCEGCARKYKCDSRLAYYEARGRLYHYRRQYIYGPAGYRMYTVEVPSQRLCVSVLGALLVELVYKLQGADAEGSELPAELPHLAKQLGLPEELEYADAHEPSDRERAEARRKKRAEKVKRIEARRKSWTTKLKRAETALKKIDTELKRLRARDAREAMKTP